MTTPLQTRPTGFRMPQGEWFNVLIAKLNQWFGSKAIQTVAAAGATQGNATVINANLGYLIKVTVTASTEGIKLPVCSTGAGPFIVLADPSVGVKIYPNTGARIETTATNTAIALVKAKSSIFIGKDKSNWAVVTGA